MMPDEGNLDLPSSQLYHEGYLNFISTTKMGENLDNMKKKKGGRDGRENLTFLISPQLEYIDLTKGLVIFLSIPISGEKKGGGGTFFFSFFLLAAMEH